MLNIVKWIFGIFFSLVFISYSISIIGGLISSANSMAVFVGFVLLAGLVSSVFMLINYVISKFKKEN